MRLFQKTAVIVVAVVAVLLLSGATAKKSAKDVVISAGDMQFKEVAPGVSRAVVWGNPAKGPYGGITRFVKGTKVGWHKHPHDIKAVVISGTLLYDNGSGEKALGPGSFLQERSNIKHTTAASADSDLEFYEEGSGPFALVMEK